MQIGADMCFVDSYMVDAEYTGDELATCLVEANHLWTRISTGHITGLQGYPEKKTHNRLALLNRSVRASD